MWRVRKQRRGSPQELLQHRQRAEAPFLSPTQNSCWCPDIYMGLHEHMVSLMSTTSQGVLCPTGPHGAGVAALGNRCLHFLLFQYTLSILYRKAWWMHTPSPTVFGISKSLPRGSPYIFRHRMYSLSCILLNFGALSDTRQ